jgi:ABC-2 type transport system permease protein
MLFFASALGYAAQNGASWSRFRADAATDALGEERNRLAALATTLDSLRADTSELRPFGDPRSPYTALQSFARRYAVLPSAPLGVLAVGQSDLFPSYYRVSMSSRETFLANDEVENPTNLLAGRFDLAFLLVYVFPLLAIALTYNVLSSEREDGTLALVASQAVRLRSVLWGKVLTRGALLLFCAGLTVLFGAAIAGADLTADGALGALSGWIAIALAYAVFWLAAAFLINVLGRSSAANALALLAVWLVLVVLVPATLATTVNVLHPVPSRVELMTAMRDASNAASARGSQLLSVYYQDHPELMAAQGGSPNMNDFATRSIAVAEEVARLTQPLAERFDTRLAAQQRIVDRWRYVSPAVAAYDALTRLAGTDGDRYREFQRQADVYVVKLKQFALPLIAGQRRFSRELLEQIPTFVFDNSAAAARSQAGRRTLASVLSMLALAGALLLMALRRAPRLGVTEA